eukprot:TRINITY_DN49057_c0_g1_i1.p1 TRINITY_DN49057_c0_g1~~TRINITY_DN49057_c0_g1_i1.p1  ORF type:complete len:647 (-),score=93.61 TRINITY_DN49057_c0_g1_i1:192-2132(-)
MAGLLKRTMSMKPNTNNDEFDVVETMVERRKGKAKEKAERSKADDESDESSAVGSEADEKNDSKTAKEVRAIRQVVSDRLAALSAKLHSSDLRTEISHLNAKIDSCLEVVLEIRAGTAASGVRMGPPKSPRPNFKNRRDEPDRADGFAEVTPNGVSMCAPYDDLSAVKAACDSFQASLNGTDATKRGASCPGSEHSAADGNAGHSHTDAFASEGGRTADHSGDGSWTRQTSVNSKDKSLRKPNRLSLVFANSGAAIPDYMPKRSSVNTEASGIIGFFTGALVRVRSRTPLQKHVWLFLEDPDMTKGGRTFEKLMAFFIMIAAAIPMLLTLEPTPIDSYAASIVSICLDVAFLCEVLVRFWVCPNCLAFFLSPYNLIDIAAGTLPLALRISSQVDSVTQLSEDGQNFQILAVCLCLVPILQVLKLLRRFETFHLLMQALSLVLSALPVLLFVLTILVLTFASFTYLVEPRSNIESLPIAIWLTIVTVGTIGYGDIVPQSTAGVMVTSALIVVSALYMAIPIGIVGKAFGEVWDDRDRLMLVHRARTRFLSGGYRAVDIPAMFCAFDADGDGGITLQEFVKMMKEMEIDIGSQRIVDLFHTFDIDRDGTIDDQEFVRTLFPNAYADIYGIHAADEVGYGGVLIEGSST